MSSSVTASIVTDQTAIRSAINAMVPNWCPPGPNALRSVSDIFLDWATIFASIWITYRIGVMISVVALLVLGNRQRALANLLHDASHRNLSAHRGVNDWLARIFLAPALLNDLHIYRSQHARHHAWLAHPASDPDYIPRITRTGDRWFHAYFRILLDLPGWTGSLLGHLASRQLRLQQWAGVLVWWITFEALIDVVCGTHFAVLFFALWVVAKSTVFHAVTTFREMIDHYGLEADGIFGNTRETPYLGLLSCWIHPHHNGYHLTHHLFPDIPYFRLPDAHHTLKQTSLFNRRAIICDSYLTGAHACVRGWGARDE